MCDPILVTFIKMQPNNSQSSRENATTSSGTYPLVYSHIPTILDKMKWNSKPPSPPPLPQINDEAAQKSKRAIFPSLIWGGGSRFSIYFVQDCSTVNSAHIQDPTPRPARRVTLQWHIRIHNQINERISFTDHIPQVTITDQSKFLAPQVA